MHHNPRRPLLAGLALSFGGIAPRLALAADPVYPAKPVTIVVPFPPGGPGDAIVRAIAEQLGQRLGQPFITDFKGGAAGVIGTDAVAKAARDGYTLLAASSDMLVNNTATFKQLPYDPLRDLTLVTQVGSLPLVLAVPRDGAHHRQRAAAGLAGQRRLRAGADFARAGPRGAGARTGYRAVARAGDGRAAAVRALLVRQNFGWRPLTTLATMPASQRPPRRHGPDRPPARSPAADRS